MNEQQVKQMLGSLRAIAACLMVIVAVGLGVGASLVQDYFQDQQPKPSKRPITLRV
jgi:hypothetical protein